MTNDVVAAAEAALNAVYVERNRAVVLAARRLARIEMAMRADPAGTQSLRDRREAIIRDLVAAVLDAAE